MISTSKNDDFLPPGGRATAFAHFSLEQYEYMVEVGAFSGPLKKRLELIRGEIVKTSPISCRHAEVVNRLREWSYDLAPREQITIRSRLPVRIPVNDSEPEPDIVWVDRKNYAQRHPEPHEVLLLNEVAEASLDTDRDEKLSVYAEAGIADYWIVNLIDEQVEVYRQPRVAPTFGRLCVAVEQSLPRPNVGAAQQ